MTEKDVEERLVADIPAKLKRAVQIRALEQGKTLKDALIEALEDWLAKQETADKAEIVLVPA